MNKENYVNYVVRINRTFNVSTLEDDLRDGKASVLNFKILCLY